MRLPGSRFRSRLALCLVLLPGVNGSHAQSPAVSPTPVPLAAVASDPVASANLLAHPQRLNEFYTEARIHRLFDFLNDTLNRQFTASLAEARACGLPEDLLTEAAVFHAKYTSDLASCQALMPRLQDIQTRWRESNSFFADRHQFDEFLHALRTALNDERMTPGSFVQVTEGARKRAQARAALSDLRDVLRDVLHYGMEHHSSMGTPVPVTDWLTYTEASSRLRATGGTDPLGRPYGLQTFGVYPTAAAETYQDLASEAPRSFWGNFFPTSTLGR